ncbi:MAG TPA: thiamine phosphate synthase [Chromatiaceae bacterium]|nr:thiamine phosphate synthase [Chromatiaceae bacterium]
MHGLYAITPAGLRGSKLLGDVEQALKGGCRILQYRNKSDDPLQRLEEARALRRLCTTHEALFIVNDDPELAEQVAADGVHLGREDASIGEARARLGEQAIIGLSCYADWQRALHARRLGADYVAFGAFYPSPTKPGAVRAGIELLRHARRDLDLPTVAIGGITTENAQPLIEAGADMVAVIQGLFGQADIRATARRFATLFEESGGSS